MKNLVKKAAFTLVLLTLALNTVFANNTETNPTEFVINGKILKSNKNEDANCKIELFHENVLMESFTQKMNKAFELKLQKNIWYTIRVTKEGYCPLLISFNTEVKENSKILDNLFAFETALIAVEDAKYMNKDLIEFPVGLVSFNSESSKFEARDVYTMNYVANLQKVDFEPSNITKADALKEEKSKAITASVDFTRTADIAKEFVTKTSLGQGMC